VQFSSVNGVDCVHKLPLCEYFSVGKMRNTIALRLKITLLIPILVTMRRYCWLQWRVCCCLL